MQQSHFWICTQDEPLAQSVVSVALLAVTAAVTLSHHQASNTCNDAVALSILVQSNTY